jgi:predicted transcriptional regulator
MNPVGAAVKSGIAEADRGEFAKPEDVCAAFAI